MTGLGSASIAIQTPSPTVMNRSLLQVTPTASGVVELKAERALTPAKEGLLLPLGGPSVGRDPRNEHRTRSPRTYIETPSC